MLKDAEKAFLEVVIDLGKAVGQNNTSAVPSLIERINSMDLSENQRNAVADAVNFDHLPDGDGYEAYQLLVNGLNCIADKESRLALLLASMAFKSGDMKKMREVLDTALSVDPPTNCYANDYRYISCLLRLCISLKDYRAMDVIREKWVI